MPQKPKGWKCPLCGAIKKRMTWANRRLVCDDCFQASDDAKFPRAPVPAPAIHIKWPHGRATEMIHKEEWR